MKTTTQQSNLILAKQLSKKLSRLSSIRTILLYGSVGKGYSDEYSDIDLVVVCDIPHSKLYSKTNEVMKLFPLHNLVFKEQELSVLQFDQYPSLNDKTIGNHLSYRSQCTILHDNRKIDTTIRLISWATVKKMESEARQDIYKYQTLIQYIIDTKTLFEKDKSFGKWKKKTGSFKTFAPKLYHDFINHCLEKLDYYLKGELPDGVARGDIVLRNYELGKCIVLFLNILYALNDRCLPYPKWEHRDIKELTIKPTNTHNMLKQVITRQDPEPIKKMLQKLQI